MNKEVKDNQEKKARILAIEAAGDSMLQCMTLMSVTFTVQKQSI